MRLVADPLQQEKRRIVFREDDRLRPVTRVQQFLFLGDADRHEIREPDLLERFVGR